MKNVAMGLFFFVIAGNCLAQGLYTRAGLGYAVPQAGQTMDGTATPYSGNRTNTTIDSVNYTAYSIKNSSFSTGIHGILGVGYMFNSHVGVDVSVDMALTPKEYTYSNSNTLVNNVPSNVQIIQKANNPVLFIPALVLQSDGARFNLYTRFGLALPLKTKITQDQVFTNLPGTGKVETDDYTFTITNKFSLGFTGTAGIGYKLSDKLCLWGEASFLSLAVYAKEANLTDVTVDGATGYLPQIPVEQRKIVFSKEFTSTSNDYFHQPTFSQPFSSFSINAGIRYNLGSSRSGNKGKNDVKSRRMKF